MKALIVKEFRELVRDRRTLAMIIAMPVLLLVIFGYAANFHVDRVSVIAVGSDAESLTRSLDKYEASADLRIVRVEPTLSSADAEQLLRDQEADAVIVSIDDSNSGDDPLLDRMHVYVDGSSLFSAQTAQGVFMQLLAEDVQDRIADVQTSVEDALARAAETETQFQQFKDELGQFQTAAQQAIASGEPLPAFPAPPEGLSVPDLPEVVTPSLNPNDFVTVLFNPDLKTSWVMIPGLIGLILLFIGTLITSIGLVRERESGTLEQLAVMPLRPSAIILGKIAPYFLLAFFDMALVTFLGVWLFNVPFVGNIWLFCLASLIFLFVVLGMGVMISSASQTTGQAIQGAIMFMVPQIMLSGLIFPLNAMPIGVRWIGYLLPLTWFREISQGIMVRGADFGALWPAFLILAVIAIVAFSAATGRMRHSLTHGGTR